MALVPGALVYISGSHEEAICVWKSGWLISTQVKGKGLQRESRFRTKSGWSLGSFQAELNLHGNHESCLDFHEAKGLANGYLANRLQTSEEIKILDLNPWPIDFCGKNMKKTCLPGTCLQKRLLSNTGLFNL